MVPLRERGRRVRGIGALALLAAGALACGFLGLGLAARPASADDFMLVPMDLEQTNHLKAYGLAYHMLTQGVQVEWLLNYRRARKLPPR